MTVVVFAVQISPCKSAVCNSSFSPSVCCLIGIMAMVVCAIQISFSLYAV